MFTAILFTIAKTWKQPKCPMTDEWINKTQYIYAMEYYSAIRENEIISFAATQMDLEIIILSEVRQRQISYDITYMQNHINDLIYRTKMDSQTQKTNWSLKGKGLGEGWIGSFGLAYEHYCIWNGWLTWTCFIAQGTLLHIL